MSDHNQGAANIQIDDPEPGSTWFVSIAGTIIFLVIVFAVAVLYFQANTKQETEQVVNKPSIEYENGRLAQQAKLADSGKWIEETPGEKVGEVKKTERLRIPIEDAMKLVGTELSGSAANAKTSSGGAGK